jgi:hypothetical protein
MVGVWDVKWDHWDVRLDLHPDGAAHFAYITAGGAYDGTWQYDEKRKMLTLKLNSSEKATVVIFDKVDFNKAEGREFNQSVKFARSKQKYLEAKRDR